MNNNKPSALLFGITGQDGSYLAELLLEMGYEVHGVIRRASSFNTGRIDHIYEDIHLHYGDVTDPLNTTNLISKLQPTWVFNLAAQSHVKVSFEEPYYTGQVDAIGTLNVLEAIKNHSPHSKLYQASTSELYGGMGYNMPDGGYTEESPFHPRSPYGVAKLYGYWIIKNYRESYGIFACNGILFNHESPRRGLTFVTKKVVDSLVRISNGKKEVLTIGNLDSFRDWGYAKDFCKGMIKMLEQDTPDDFVLSTGESHSVRELIEVGCKFLGMELEWSGSGLEEVGIDKKTGQVIVKIDEKYFRPAEVEYLKGDYSKAKKVLGWEPETGFEALVHMMILEEKQKIVKENLLV